MSKKKVKRKFEPLAQEVWRSSQQRQLLKDLLKQTKGTHFKAPPEIERNIYRAFLVLLLKKSPDGKLRVPRREAAAIASRSMLGGSGILKLDNTPDEWVIELIEPKEQSH